MQNFRNYYEILGVAQEATADEIKRAYRQLARRYHPDLNPGDTSAEEKFKLLGEAYNVLSDAEKRSQYEQFSQYWKQKGFQDVFNRNKGAKERSNGWVSFEDFNFAEFRDFNSFVDQLLNRRRDAASPAADRAATEAAVPEYAAAPPRDRPTQARPTGEPAAARRAGRAGPATARVSQPGPARSGDRRDAEADLTIPLARAFAGGRERIRLEDGRSLEVNMPAGMVTGQRIRLKGQGVGGGNLYLRIEVEPHPFFSLQGDDVFCRLPLTPSEAALGGTLEVPTLDGPVRMTIPAGVQPGQRLRLAGKGYPVGQERRGDQIVEVEIAIPSRLSDREKALYSELRQMETLAPRANLPV
jgi:curved DNA-binding protein